MMNLVKAEWLKLRKSKSLIGIILGEIIIVLYVILGAIVGIEQGIMTRTEATGIESIKMIIGAPDMMMIFLGFFAGYFITKDLENEGIRYALSYGYKKEQVILSKLIVYLAMSILLSNIPLILTGIVMTAGYGWGEIIDAPHILYIIRIVVLNSMATLANASIIALFAFWCKKVTRTIIVSCVFSESITILAVVLKQFQPKLFNVLASNGYIVADKVMQMNASMQDIKGTFISALVIGGIALLSIMKITESYD